MRYGVSMSKKSVRVLVTTLVLAGAFVGLMAVTMRDEAMIYKRVDEVVPVASEWYGKNLQLHGFVVDGSIMRRPNTLDYRFDVKNGDSVVRASYTGVVPDTFKDGAEVVLKGRLHESGFEVAPNGVMAKCPSKYEPGAAQGYEAAKTVVN
jgi:cytochrome c-type biogenesis protein CcmE